MQGWISIHRKIMENPVWQDPKLLKLWMLCLLEASHKEHEQLVGRQVVKLLPGQFVTGRFALARVYNEGAKKSDVVPESTLWRWLKWFEEINLVNIKSTTKFSVVTINNWDKYQQNEQQMNNKKQGFSSSDQQNSLKSEQQNFNENPFVATDSNLLDYGIEQQMNNKWTTNEQQMNTNNNGNNVNNVAVVEDPFGNYERTIIQKYIQLAGIGGFDIPERDKEAVRQVIREGVPLEDSMKLLDQCFKDYKPKHARDKINSFSYCATYILNKYSQKRDGASNVYPINSRSNGRAKSESKPKPKSEPILGDFVGRLPRKKV